MGDRNTSVDDFFSLVTEGTIPAPQPEVLGMPLIDQVVGRNSRTKQHQPAEEGAGIVVEHPSHENETKAVRSPGDSAQPDNGQNSRPPFGKEDEHQDSRPPHKKVKTEEGTADTPTPQAFETQQVTNQEG